MSRRKRTTDPRRLLARLAKDTAELVRYCEYANHAKRNFWNAHQCRVGAAKRAGMKLGLARTLTAIDKALSPAARYLRLMAMIVRLYTLLVAAETNHFPKDQAWPGTDALARQQEDIAILRDRLRVLRKNPSAQP